MQISPDILFDIGAIQCHHMRLDPGGQDVRMRPARVVFVTQPVVEACRAAQSPGRAMGNFHLGEIVALLRDDDGSSRGFVLSGVEDGGLAISFEDQDGRRMLPFTGKHLLDAREMIGARLRTGAPVGDDLLRLHQAIGDLFSLVRAAPNARRFPEALHGMAFRSAILDETNGAYLDLPDTDLARYCIANSLRARIRAINPDHPDALGVHLAHDEMLNSFGVSPAGSQARRNPRSFVEPQEFLQCLAEITHIPAARIPMSILSLEDVDLLREKAREDMLSGDWAEVFGSNAEEALWHEIQAGAEEELAQAMVLQSCGRDILVLRLDGGGDGSFGLVYSWPSVDRRMTLTTGEDVFVCISPEEVPSPDTISRLTRALADLLIEQKYDSPEEVL